MRILNSREKAEIEKMLKNVYGCEDVFSGYVVLLDESKEIWLTNKEIFDIDLKKLRVRSIGLYFGRIENEKVRLSVEASQMVAKSAKKNIAEIKEAWDFLRGFDVTAADFAGCKEGEYVLVGCNEDILGVAKLEAGILKNVLPKTRKITSLTKGI